MILLGGTRLEVKVEFYSILEILLTRKDVLRRFSTHYIVSDPSLDYLYSVTIGVPS